MTSFDVILRYDVILLCYWAIWHFSTLLRYLTLWRFQGYLTFVRYFTIWRNLTLIWAITLFDAILRNDASYGVISPHFKVLHSITLISYCVSMFFYITALYDAILRHDLIMSAHVILHYDVILPYFTLWLFDILCYCHFILFYVITLIDAINSTLLCVIKLRHRTLFYVITLFHVITYIGLFYVIACLRCFVIWQYSTLFYVTWGYVITHFDVFTSLCD